jgi:hypothetical protein
MRSRLFSRLILVVSFVALVTSAYAVSGVSGVSRAKVSGVLLGVPGTPKAEGVGGSRTSPPSNTPDDGVWEAATHVATTAGSSFRIRTHICVASLAHSGSVLTGWNAHTSSLRDVVRDRSPQHSLPLLI